MRTFQQNEPGRSDSQPDLPEVVDAHHHLWDLSANHYPWLLDPKTPRLYGDHSPICRDYRLADYSVDAQNQKIVKSVHVQADHDFADPVRETRWLQSVADGNPAGLPHAIVAYADLAAPNAPEVLEAHCGYTNMRGIRQALNGAVTNPARHPDLLASDVWRRNIALLAHYGLSFDLQVLPVQMPAAWTLVRAQEAVQFILLHLGLPMDQTADGLRFWAEQMQHLAELPNLAVKISGFGMFDRAWTRKSIRPMVLRTIELFGPERTMFGSNFPVDGMMASFDEIWGAYFAITADFSEDERRAMFRKNAERFYRI